MSGAVPELRFPGFEGEWVKCRVGDFATFQRGFDLPSQERRAGNFPIVSSSGVSGYHDEAKVDRPGLVTGRYGSIGELFFIDQPHWPLNTSLWVNDFHGNNIYFAFHNLGRVDFRKLSDKTGVPGVNRNDLHKVKIGVPTLPEQRKIATFLGTLGAKLTALREKADALRQFKTGLMQKLFSQELRFTREDGSEFPDWEEKPFSEIATRAGEQFDPRKENGSPIVIELENLESASGKILSSVDIDGQISLKNRFRSGDVLFGKLRPYLRKFARPDFDGVCSSEIWVLRGREGVSNGFLYALVQSSLFGQVANISSGSKMPRADWRTIAGVDFPVPCSEEQEKIASALTTLDAKIDAMTDQITHMETFKKGLLQKMFV